MKNNEKLDIVLDAIKSKKGKNVTVIDLKGISIIADHFVICSGTSKPNVQAISNEINKRIREEKVKKLGIEGYRTGNWILHDLGDIIVHIMNEETRNFYNLERLWRDGKITEIKE